MNLWEHHADHHVFKSTRPAHCHPSPVKFASEFAHLVFRFMREIRQNYNSGDVE